MRIKLSYEILEGDKIILPVHYNYHIHGLIYRTFSNELASRLHDGGFIVGKRPFKLFTFSRILEKGKLMKNGKDAKLIFGRKISFYFSSSVDNIVADLGEMSFKRREFSICGQRIYLSQLEVITPPRLEGRVLIKTLSPLTVYSTFKKEDGEEVFHYYKPYEEGFQKLIEDNAKKKYRAVYEKEPDGLRLHIKPYKFSIEKNHSVVFFKNNPIEGWTGIYELSGSPELITVTYNAGLGSKNSEGFGMWDIWRGGERDA
ncbi:MAG: CRISPR-associated endoribonuclease Cas6 [bacterium]|nr:CRISPR-associated endoribonuclease Cas6 [bacterium]